MVEEVRTVAIPGAIWVHPQENPLLCPAETTVVFPLLYHYKY